MRKRVRVVPPSTRGQRFRCWLFGHRLGALEETSFLYDEHDRLVGMLCMRCSQPLPDRVWLGVLCEYGTFVALASAIGAAVAGCPTAAGVSMVAAIPCILLT